MTYKIIIQSGGQTGVDLAALDVAISLGISYDGWCPKGRLNESGIIPSCYALKETQTSEYSERTRLNIRDSDGTLIFVPTLPLKVNDGTNLTIDYVIQTKRKYLIVDLSKPFEIYPVIHWIQDCNIKMLNIAGPRESQSLGIYDTAKNFLFDCMSILKNKD